MVDKLFGQNSKVRTYQEHASAERLSGKGSYSGQAMSRRALQSRFNVAAERLARVQGHGLRHNAPPTRRVRSPSRPANRPTNLIRLLQEFARHMDRLVARPCCSGLNPAVPVIVDHVPNHQQRPDPWSRASWHHGSISLNEAKTDQQPGIAAPRSARPPLQPPPPLVLCRCLGSPATDPPARSTLGSQCRPAAAPLTTEGDRPDGRSATPRLAGRCVLLNGVADAARQVLYRWAAGYAGYFLAISRCAV